MYVCNQITTTKLIFKNQAIIVGSRYVCIFISKLLERKFVNEKYLWSGIGHYNNDH